MLSKVMQSACSIYWRIGSFVYSKFMHVGKRAKIHWGGVIKAGKNIWIGDDFFIGRDFLLAVYAKDMRSQPDGRLIIGSRVCAQERVRISCIESVIIEDDVLFASNILITDNNHGMNPESELSYAGQENTAKPVHIGRGCWIGEQVIVLAGSTIGEKCIIGANSVVNGYVPPFSIAAGTPARVIKKWDFEMKKWVRMN